MAVRELDTELTERGYAYGTIRRTKEQLKSEHVISFHQSGNRDSKQWTVHLHIPLLEIQKCTNEEKS